MKTFIVILALALSACGDGGKVPIAEGVRCGDADLTNAPAGWCSNPDDIIHLGAPNSDGAISGVVGAAAGAVAGAVVSATADSATKEAK